MKARLWNQFMEPKNMSDMASRNLFASANIWLASSRRYSGDSSASASSNKGSASDIKIEVRVENRQSSDKHESKNKSVDIEGTIEGTVSRPMTERSSKQWTTLAERKGTVDEV